MWEIAKGVFSAYDWIVLGPIFLMLGTIATGSPIIALLDLVGWWLYTGSVLLGLVYLLNGHFTAGIVLLVATAGFSLLKWYRDKRDADRMEAELRASKDWMKDR